MSSQRPAKARRTNSEGSRDVSLPPISHIFSTPSREYDDSVALPPLRSQTLSHPRDPRSPHAQSYGPPPVHPSQMASPPASHPHVRNPGHNWNPSSAMPSRSDAYTSSSHRMGQSMQPSAYQSPGHHPHQTLHSAHHPASMSPSTRHGSGYRPSTSGPVGMSAYPSASASYSRVAPPQAAPLQAGPSSSQYSRNVATAHAPTSSSEDLGTSNPKTKYECSYCGKGFLRPSALKIHIISHTGDKGEHFHEFIYVHLFIGYVTFFVDFVCPEESCGRRFGVRSNMLRHIRLVHQNNLHHSSGEELSKDEWSESSE
ncbi:hypothetical protein VKT23_000599 [Stygiomarasmius scandens]|uniref:C2H2-type domain-containing protein n=1 Tax=Marasmiellus scandens TaxID=2682957 RepID=A0ABR1K4Y1_9AGAR